MTKLAIETQALTRRFGNFTAVDQLDLQIPESTIYGFLGPNGCGKSTTIRMLCGLLTPSAGTASVLGLRIPAESEQLKRKIGYMTQQFSLYDNMTAQENLQFMGQIFGIGHRPLKKRIDELLSLYSLQAISKQRTGSMSGGQRQRLALATATLHKPSLLFLDEPTAAVDPENRRNFWEKLFDLCDQGTTILVSTHYMDEAERCHQLAILDNGQLKAQGSPPQLMQEMAAHVIELTGPNLRETKNTLLQLAAVRSAAQQGLRLRVLVKHTIEDPIQYLKQAITAADYEFSMVHASLEDVFVCVTGGA